MAADEWPVKGFVLAEHLLKRGQRLDLVVSYLIYFRCLINDLSVGGVSKCTCSPRQVRGKYILKPLTKDQGFLGMADIGINITGSIGHPKSNCLYRTENNRVFPFTSLHSVKSWRKSLYSAGV